LKEARALPPDERRRVFDAVELLRGDPLRGKPLRAAWKGFRRVRVGQCRVIYAFDGTQLLVFVVRVAWRKEAYR
jgi:mRNA-degrading endonuclease RelE of RelBE toxin-antitoxin system